MTTVDRLITALRLEPHPEEGGYFRETYRSDEVLRREAIGDRYDGPRNVSTAIYYLLKPGTFSALHRLKSDELFHFYCGSPVRMLQLFPDGSGREIVIGPDVLAGQLPQVVVPRGTWQGSLLEPGGEYALLGCTVAPGFDYADYEHGDRDVLIAQYPQFRERIEQLTTG